MQFFFLQLSIYYVVALFAAIAGCSAWIPVVKVKDKRTNPTGYMTDVFGETGKHVECLSNAGGTIVSGN